MTARAGHAVVGVDESPSAARAVAWAIDEAQRRSLALQFVSLWHLPLMVVGPTSAVAIPTMLAVARHRARIAVERAADAAAQAGVTATVEVIEGAPATALAQLSRGADQLVVGERGVSIISRALGGSTSLALTRRPQCPVTVVRHQPLQVHHRVVVGVDGSPAARAALARAVVEAEARRATVFAVAAWRATDPALVSEFSGDVSPEPEEIAALARALAEEAVRQELGPRDDVRIVVRHGDAGDVLVDSAAHADLLVVGTNGFGQFDRLLLGSVSSRCVRTADSPVQVVPSAAGA